MARHEAASSGRRLISCRAPVKPLAGILRFLSRLSSHGHRSPVPSLFADRLSAPGQTLTPAAPAELGGFGSAAPKPLGWRGSGAFPVLRAPQAPTQGLNFTPEQGGAYREGDPAKPGLWTTLANTGLDMLLGNKPGPSDRYLWHMGGGGAGSWLTGQLPPQVLEQLEAVRLGRLGAGDTANAFAANLGGWR